MFKFTKNDKGKETAPQKSAAQRPVREYSEEEKKKVDNQKVDRDSMVAALKAIGKTDEEIESMFPKPLSDAEQNEKVLHIRELLNEKKYAELISFGVELYKRQAFTGNNLKVAGWMIGLSAITTHDQENAKEFAEYAVLGYLTFIGLKEEKGATCAIQMMELGESLVPGCMHNTALKIYPLFRDYYGDGHDYTLRIKKYL